MTWGRIYKLSVLSLHLCILDIIIVLHEVFINIK